MKAPAGPAMAAKFDITFALHLATVSLCLASERRSSFFIESVSWRIFENRAEDEEETSDNNMSSQIRLALVVSGALGRLLVASPFLAAETGTRRQIRATPKKAMAL